MTSDYPLLLVLGGASPQQGLRVIGQAKSRGMQVWLTDTATALTEHPETAAKADYVTELPYQDPAVCVSWAVEQARTRRIAGVFGFREYSVEAVAAVAEALGLPGNPPDVVRCVRHKPSCRQTLRELGFSQPPGMLCQDLKEARRFAAQHLPGPWVVKPPAAMGSQGVSLVRGDADWEPALANLGTLRSPFLVEGFQSGAEFSAEGLFVSGEPHVLALTAKITTGAPHFVELGHTMQADLDDVVRADAIQTVTSALRALGLRWGPFHVEFWVERGQIVLGEVHVRPGGDYINYMTELVTGIDLYGAVFDQFLGRIPDTGAWTQQQGAAIRFLTLPPGRVLSIQGWEEVVADSTCQAAELHVKAGDVVKPVCSSADRSGFVLAVGPTAQAAANAAERLREGVAVVVGGEAGDDHKR